MFSSINPVEVSAEGNVIDMEIRISEGKPAYFNNVTQLEMIKPMTMLFIEN